MLMPDIAEQLILSKNLRGDLSCSEIRCGYAIGDFCATIIRNESSHWELFGANRPLNAILFRTSSRTCNPDACTELPKKSRYPSATFAR